MKTDTRDQRDTNSGFHPPMANDGPASKGMLLIILVLLVVGSIIAVIAYNRYNSDPKFPDAPQQETPPLTP